MNDCRRVALGFLVAWAGSAGAQALQTDQFRSFAEGFGYGRLVTATDVAMSGSRKDDRESYAHPVVLRIPISTAGAVSTTSLRAPGTPNTLGSGTNLSRDGSCTVGFQDAGPLSPLHALRWTQASGPVDLGTLDPPNDGSRTSSANDASADCSVVVGHSNTTSTFIVHAFRWTAASGMVDLGAPAGAERQSRGLGVSADGSVVVGDAEFQIGSPGGPFILSEAFRWTEGTFQSLGAGAFRSVATAITADGALVVGQIAGASGSSAFRWTQPAGTVTLGALPGFPVAMATAVSDNGRVIAGTLSTSTVPLEPRSGNGPERGEGAFRWTEAGGMQDLRQLLASRGVDMTGITLLTVSGMSIDGQWITGKASTPTTPIGESVGYLVQYCDDAIGGSCSIGNAPPFTVGASSGALTVAAGASATTTLTLTPRAGFTDPISLACTGLPAGAACQFAPSTLTPAGAPLTTTLTITTDGGPVALGASALPGAAAFAAFAAFGLGVRRRRAHRHLHDRAAILFVSLIAGSIAACGGGGGNPPLPITGTPAGNSTVTVTATSGSGASATTATLPIALTVTR